MKNTEFYVDENELRSIEFVKVDEGGTVVCVKLRGGNSHRVGHWIGYADMVRVIPAKA